MVGDPINASTGNWFAEESDYSSSGFVFKRYYNSSSYIGYSHLGPQWRHTYDRFLEIRVTDVQHTAVLYRPDGKQERFNQSGAAWSSDPDITDTLTEIDNAQNVATGYKVFIGALREYETYDTSGLLQAITNANGQTTLFAYSTSATPATVAPEVGLLLTVTDTKDRQLQFTYDGQSHIHQIILPDGGTLTYAYDVTSGNLLSVTYPDGKTQQYTYNESSLTGGASLPNSITGVVDETNSRYQNIAYNASGQAVASGFIGNIDMTKITYNSNGTSAVQYPLGLTSTMTFLTTSNGLIRSATLDQPCGNECNQPWKSRTYDVNGYPASYTDFNGGVTKTTYDASGLLDQQIDASGTTSQRTTNFTWNTTLRVPLTRVVLDASGNTIGAAQWVYNSIGQTLARCEIDPGNSAASGYACSNAGSVPAGVRRWTYTYCTAVDTTQCPVVGLMLTATGPRTDIAQTTIYSYYMARSTTNCGTPGAACYQAGDLHTVIDPVGHVTTIASYDAAGRITRTTDANGINTDLTYTPRGWLASRSMGGAATSFTYTPYGAVQTVTDPDGTTTTYGYDAAHRLVKITDAQGNYVQYTLDAAGNKTAEQVYDSTGTLHKSLSRTFNTLGQLTKVMDGLSHTVFDASASGNYDANGNLIQSADGLGIQRQMGYDALNRLVQTLDNYNGTN
jgi:YD repeat-containing protein